MSRLPSPTPIELVRLETWPEPSLSLLEEHQQFLINFARGVAAEGSLRQHEKIVAQLAEMLRGHALTGWHCTRLADREIDAILVGGMQVPDEGMLLRRIDALVAEGLIPSSPSVSLKAKNEAHQENRKMVWFCFYPPRRAGKGGISDFFRYWGGESLYNSDVGDPAMAKLLGTIGTACLIEADVPLDLFKNPAGVASAMIQQFLVTRGLLSGESLKLEDRIVRPLPSNAIRQIIRHPSDDFRELTGSNGWKRPIPVGNC